MDYLLNTMKSIVQLDEQLTAYRKSDMAEQYEIQKLEKNLTNQLTGISTQLDNQSISNQVQILSNQFQDSQLLTKLRPIVLSGSFYYVNTSIYFIELNN